MEQSTMSRVDIHLKSYEFQLYKNWISFYDDLIQQKGILIENYGIKQLSNYRDYLDKDYSSLFEINLYPSDQKKVYEVINSDITSIVVNVMGAC
jgi:hypothetical protein